MWTAAAAILTPAVALGQVRLARDWEIEPPRPAASRPMTEAEAARFQALRLFVRGQVLERQNRLVEAVKAYEKALAYDPNAAALYKALIPLCFALDRDLQALEYCRKALELEPDNFPLAYRYASELHDRGQTDQALTVLMAAAGHPKLAQDSLTSAQVHFLLAELWADQQLYAKAAQALRAAAQALESLQAGGGVPPGAPRQQLEEELARTYEKLGQMELRAENFDSAVEAFRKAQELVPARASRLHYNLAEVHLAQGRPQAALAALQEYLATSPGGSEPYELLVTLLTQLHRSKEIIPALEQASSRDPFNQPLRLLLAREYARAGLVRKAETTYLASLSDYPSEEAYRGLARLYQGQNRWTELVRKLDQDFSAPRHLPSAQVQLQVLDQEPELVRGLAQTARQFPRGGSSLHFQTRRALASLCRKHKFYDLAEHFCRLCLPDDPHPGEAYLELCRILNESRKWEALAQVCREALRQQLQVPALVFQLELSRALTLTGKHREALAAAQAALQQAAPGTDEAFQAHYTLIVALYRSQQYDLAAREAERLLSATREAYRRQKVHYLLSVIHSAQKEWAKVEFHLQQVLELDPDDAAACNDLGYLWADQGRNLVEAEKLIRKAIALDRSSRHKPAAPLEDKAADGDNAAYVDSLGWVLFRQGRLQEARQELERAARLMTEEDPVVWDHLGEVYGELGLAEQAQTAWQKALHLYRTSTRPDPERIRSVSEKLQRLRETPAGPKR
jgi:tetratricopeptide (TPR) repeat protein